MQEVACLFCGYWVLFATLEAKCAHITSVALFHAQACGPIRVSRCQTLTGQHHSRGTHRDSTVMLIYV